MSAPGPSAGSYARAIERILERVRGAPVVLSPRDFRYVADWHARGVPVALVLEGIEAAATRRRGRSSRPRTITLAYVAPGVEEAWGVVLAGRMVDPAQRRACPADPASIRQRWVDAAARAGDGSALGRLVAGGIRSLDAGDDAAAVDLALDAALVEAAPEGMVRAIAARVDADLQAFAARMKPSGLITTQRRAVVDRLRQSLDLPRLSNLRGGARKRVEPA